MISNKLNSMWLAIQYISTMVFSLITLKLNLLQFGKENFGIWIMFASFWGIGAVLDLGFGTALIRLVAGVSDEKNDIINKLLSTCFFMLISLGLLLLTLGIIFGNYIFFEMGHLIPLKYFSESREVFFIMGGTFYLNFVMVFFKSVFEGNNDFIISSRLSILYNCYILFSVSIVFIFNFSLVILALLYLISAILNNTFLYILYKRKYSRLKISAKYFDRKQIKKIIGFSSAVQLTSIFNVLIDPTVKYIMGSFFNTSFISIYEIARRFSTAISSLFFTSFKNILPLTSKLKSAEAYKDFILNEASRYIKMGIVYSGVIFGILSVAIVYFLVYFFGEKEIIVFFLILAIPETINNFGYTLYITLLGAGKAGFLALIQFNNLIITVFCVSIGFTIFKSPLGLLGYLISVILANVLILIKTRNDFNINIASIVKNKDMFKFISLLISLMLLVLIINTNNGYAPFALGTSTIIMLILFFSDGLIYIKEIFAIFRRLISQSMYSKK